MADQIHDQIRGRIVTGRLAADERLPSVRQLAKDLGIAPGTAAKAHRALEAEGFLVEAEPASAPPQPQQRDPCSKPPAVRKGLTLIRGTVLSGCTLSTLTPQADAAGWRVLTVSLRNSTGGPADAMATAPRLLLSAAINLAELGLEGEH